MFQLHTSVVRGAGAMNDRNGMSSGKTDTDEQRSSSAIGEEEPPPAGEPSSSDGSDEGRTSDSRHTKQNGRTGLSDPSERREQRKQNRIMANRRSARASRERRIKYMSDLEKTVDELTAQNTGLLRQTEMLVAEVRILRGELTMYRNMVGSHQRNDLSGGWPPPPTTANGAMMTGLSPGHLLGALMNQQSAQARPPVVPSFHYQAAMLPTARMDAAEVGAMDNAMSFGGFLAREAMNGAGRPLDNGAAPYLSHGVDLTADQIALLAARQQLLRQSTRDTSTEENQLENELQRKPDAGGGPRPS